MDEEKRLALTSNGRYCADDIAYIPPAFSSRSAGLRAGRAFELIHPRQLFQSLAL
jgi:hypothetical protein